METTPKEGEEEKVPETAEFRKEESQLHDIIENLLIENGQLKEQLANRERQIEHLKKAIK